MADQKAARKEPSARKALRKAPRKENWPEILNDQIEQAQAREFEWGVFDCCLFAADVVLAMTDVDYAASFRGRYKTKAGAYRCLKNHSGDIKEVLNSLLGEPIPVAYCSRGDIVTLETDDGLAMGVCVGARMAVPRPGVGLTFVPMSRALMAWRV